MQLTKTAKTKVNRKSKRASYDRKFIYDTIDEIIIGHLAFQLNGEVHSIPLPFWRIDNYLYCHCSIQSRLVKLVENKTKVAISFSQVDAMVLAKSAVHHSMNYRSVVLYDIFSLVTDDQTKTNVFAKFVNFVANDRYKEVRPPNRKELNSAALLKIEISEAVAKSRSGMPKDKKSDLDSNVWSGIVPVVRTNGFPVPDQYSINLNCNEDRVSRKDLQLPTMQDLVGNYVRLKQLNVEEHANKLFKEIGGKENNDLWQYLPFGPFKNIHAFTTWLKQANTQGMYYVIYNLDNNKISGLVSFHDIDLDNGKIEIGSVVYAKHLQRTRAATETIYLMLKEIFTLGYRRCQWRCHALNLKSRRAAERYGFKFEGVFCNDMIVKGRNRDTTWFSLLDEKWGFIDSIYKNWLARSNFLANGTQIKKLII